MKKACCLMVLFLTSCTITPMHVEKSTTKVLTTDNMTNYILKSNAKLSKVEATKIVEAAQKASIKHGIPYHLIIAVTKVESNFKRDARSHVGARGLMQLMTKTAREVGVLDVLDIHQNIDGGTAYLKLMFNKFNSIDRALAAYNAGPGAWRKGIVYAQKVLRTQYEIAKIMQSNDGVRLY